MPKKIQLVNNLLAFTLPLYSVLKAVAGERPLGPVIENMLREHRDVKAKAKEMGVKIPKREANMRGKNRVG